MFGGLAVSLFTLGQAGQKPKVVSKSKVDVVGPTLAPVKAGKLDVKNKHLAQISGHHDDQIVTDSIAPSAQNKKIELPRDFILTDADKVTLDTLIARLARVQDFVGYGNFNVISLDQSLRIAQNQNQIGSFSKTELDFIEELFFTNAGVLGFYGDKVVTELSATIPKNDIVKIPGTGHHLFKGVAAETYQKIRREVGDSIILTSGIRSVVKQLHLFLGKANNTDGNLSLASYSVAPPGHSYHALGDFDVGKTGFGKKNFSEEFVHTEEFKRLSDLGYLDFRYPQNNPYGVRYEPWHIKVV